MDLQKGHFVVDDSGYLSFQGILCPNCSARNRGGANYCDHCGRPLNLTCANCGNKNRLKANYCDHCGSHLAGSPEQVSSTPVHSESGAPQVAVQPTQTTPKPDGPAGLEPGLRRHINEAFAARLETARSEKTMLGERRIVTFLFCDMEGSTAAAGAMDPEEWAEIVNEVFEIMIQPVYLYEGIVARLMGDAILAFFGAPIAHEDDPQRAVLAGLEIVQKMQAYREGFNYRHGADIHLRVGINTGMVMVGQVGSDLQMEYTALGDAINIANRMEQTARPDTVQVAEDTYRLVAPLFEFEDLGTVEVKGKPEPVHTYRPLAVKAQPGRLRGIEGLNAPLVGREAEIQTLLTAIEGLQRGVGKIIFLVGEAGLGKSRLIREAKDAARTAFGLSGRRESATEAGMEAGMEIVWYEAASLSYETITPYGLFQHLFSTLWGISANDSTGTVREKIASGLELYPLDNRPQVQAIFETLLGKQTDLTSLNLEGEELKRRLFEIVLDIWRYKAAQAPSVLVFDDLHWTDPASMELLLHLVQLTDQVPLLVFCATRFVPNSPAWRAKQVLETRYPHRLVEIQLRPLSLAESDALVDRLLDIADLPAPLRSRILEKTDGNPFFIEEVIRVLIDRGVLIPEVDHSGLPGEIHWRAVSGLEQAGEDLFDIPENLLTLLIARIDRLEEQARHTLQLAAVIGRSFYYRILQAINQPQLPVQEELDRQLLVLQQSELIREAARIPELEYTFRHSLTQEAAYETILHRQRREFHNRVGAAIEQLFANRLEEFYPILAHHFGEAGDVRALKYTLLSAEAAFRLYAIPEAQVYYDRALEIARQQREELSSEDWIQLYNRRGRVFELQSRYPEALQNYEEMAALARRRDDPVMQLAALLAHTTAIAIPTPVQDSQTAKELSEQALALARRLGDRKAEAKILWNFLLLHNYSGHMRDGIPYGEQSVTLARACDFSEQLAYSLQDLSLSYMGVGMLVEARQVLEEASTIWREIGNLPMLAENMANGAMHRLLTGDFQACIDLSNESFRLSQQIKNEWGQANSRIFVSLAYLARGEIDHALEILQVVIPLAQRIGHPSSILNRVELALVFQSIGALDKAFEVAREADEASKAFPPFRAIALASLAKLYLEAGDLAEAVRYIEESFQAGFEETLLNVDVSRLLTHIEILLARKAYSEAVEAIEAQLRVLRSAGVRYILPEAFHLKARCLAALGQSEAAYACLLEAQDLAIELNARSVGWRILADLSRLAYNRGDEEQARLLREQAEEIVRFIASHIADEELKARFIEFSADEFE